MLYHGRMNRCAKLKECPASQYLRCEAWSSGMDCWEVASPRCSSGLHLCLQYGCPVYERFNAEIEATLKSRAMEPLRTSREETETTD